MTATSRGVTTQSPTTGVALLGNPSATSTVPPPISTKRSGSIPHPPAPYNNRGNVWYAQRDFDRAIADFDAALKIFSQPCEIALRPWSRQAPEGRRQRQRRHRRGQGDPG